MQQGGDYDIEVNQGAIWYETFQWCEDDETTVIPLTGYTVVAQVRRHKDSSSLLLATFTTAVDEDEGEITLTLPSAVTTTLSENGFYDVKISNGGEPIRFIQGRMILDWQVTA